MPVFNAARYLREALDSVVGQSYGEWELIAVDDGSTDGSGAILKEYAESEARVKILHQENLGVSIARNRGLECARGDYITWIDADDVYAPWRLEDLARIIDNEEPDLVRTRMIKGEVSSFKNFSRGKYTAIEGSAAADWVWTELMPMGMLWMFAARRELYAGNAFVPGMRIKEEASVCAAFADRVNKVVQSEACSYFYRQLASSAMKSKRKTEDCVRLLGVMKTILSQCDKKTDAARRCIRMHCECDVIDWAINHDNSTGVVEIYSIWKGLRDIGVFGAESLLQPRYRIPIWWFDITGQIWPIIFVERFFRLGGKSFRRLARCAGSLSR